MQAPQGGRGGGGICGGGDGAAGDGGGLGSAGGAREMGPADLVARVFQQEIVAETEAQAPVVVSGEALLAEPVGGHKTRYRHVRNRIRPVLHVATELIDVSHYLVLLLLCYLAVVQDDWLVVHVELSGYRNARVLLRADGVVGEVEPSQLIQLDDLVYLLQGVHQVVREVQVREAGQTVHAVQVLQSVVGYAE